MEPVYFKTESNNCYLFLPSVKYLIPIPNSLYEDLSIKGDSDNTIWITLKNKGFLVNHKQDFTGVVDGSAIRSAILHLSQIVFETTTSCNLRCEYCCYSEGYDTFDSRRSLHGNLKFETAKAILDYLCSVFKQEAESSAPLEPFAISFYGGEPLMNFNVIKKIVAYAEVSEFRNRRISFTMTTNAMLLAKYADFLQAHNFKLLVSLDGNRQHDAYRRTIEHKESFDIVMSNLKNVKERYPEWFRTIRFNSVFTDISDTKEIIHWFRRTFNTIPNFSPLHTPTKGAKEYVKIKSMVSHFEIPDDTSINDEVLAQSPMNRRALEFCNRLLYNTFTSDGSLNDTYNVIPTGTCIPFTKRMFVSFDGKIHPCEKVNRDHPFGEIKEDGAVSIDFECVAESFMNSLSAQSKICQHCYLQLCCTKCMYCFDGKSCEDFADKEKFTSILSQTVSHIEKHPGIVESVKENIIFK